MNTEAKNALLDNLEHFTEQRQTFTELVEATGIFPSCYSVPHGIQSECQRDIYLFNKGKISLDMLVRRMEILDLRAWCDRHGVSVPHRAPADEEKPKSA